MTLNEVELKFQEWLDSRNYGYLFIEQSPETYASLFRNITAKRPDFLIILPSIGLIAVDIKYGQMNENYEDFILDEKKELMKYASFERLFKIPIWLAYSNEGCRYRTWYWISLSEIQEKVPTKISGKSHEPFKAINIKDCITIGWNDNLSRLFLKR
ncbi:MAG: hypothetical protein ACFFCV_11595 [Promethearchaeota archaeon]